MARNVCSGENIGGRLISVCIVAAADFGVVALALVTLDGVVVECLLRDLDLVRSDVRYAFEVLSTVFSTVAGSAAAAAGVVGVGFTIFFGGCGRGVAAVAFLLVDSPPPPPSFTILFWHTLKQQR